MEFKVTKKHQSKDIQILEYTMKNEFLEVRFLNVGGAITKIAMQEDDFKENLVLAYDNYEDYLNNDCFLGALVGRTSNRIKDGQFEINGKAFQVDLNDGPNNLHGGVENLSQTIFTVEQCSNGYVLSTLLPHQKVGFPGNLEVKVYYTLNQNKWIVSYEARTDEDTIVNLTQHAYFNLSGNLKAPIDQHLLQIKADYVAEVNENSSFTGTEFAVKNNLFDFNSSRKVAPEGFEILPQYDRTSGYDHLYLLNQLKSAAIFEDLQSGRCLKISTTSPSMQFYSGNYIDSDRLFENERPGEIYLGACFETHHIPYDFESQLLKVGDVYKEETIFEFTK